MNASLSEMPSMPTPQFIRTNGIDMAVHIAAGQADSSLPVVLLHGFPELAFSWRYQVAALAQAGYRVIAPDLRGYGGTGPQGKVRDYRMANLELDVLGLLDALSIPKAVLIGHDFGGALAWSIARDHADRVLGVIALNTPYTRRAKVDLLEAVRQARGNSHYMVTFQEPGVGEALLGADVEATFRGLMRRPALTLAEFEKAPARLRALPATLFLGEPAVMGQALLGAEELAVFTQAFRRTGFAGALNWYRNLKQNWEDTANTPDRVLAPALMISAADDYFLPPATTLGMERSVPNLEREIVSGCGHWTQQERPMKVNRLLLDWLNRHS
jgi:pimeloyl-ACP methyl ester carboxylesterase